MFVWVSWVTCQHRQKANWNQSPPLPHHQCPVDALLHLHWVLQRHPRKTSQHLCNKIECWTESQKQVHNTTHVPFAPSITEADRSSIDCDCSPASPLPFLLCSFIPAITSSKRWVSEFSWLISSALFLASIWYRSIACLSFSHSILISSFSFLLASIFASAPSLCAWMWRVWGLKRTRHWIKGTHQPSIPLARLAAH